MTQKLSLFMKKLLPVRKISFENDSIIPSHRAGQKAFNKIIIMNVRGPGLIDQIVLKLKNSPNVRWKGIK